jgi:hypothetical protein
MKGNFKTRKKSLHDTLIQTVDSVVAVLEPYAVSGRVPKEPITEARHRPEGGYVYHHYHRRDYTGLATRHSSEWVNLPMVNKAILELLNDRDIQQDFNIVGFGNLQDYVTEQIVHQFIYRILRLTKRWPPSKTIIETSFREFEDYLLGTTVSCEAIVPLQGFECERKKLVLEKDIEIHELREREKETLLSKVIGGWSLENQMEAMSHKFVAIINLSWAKGSPPSIDHRVKLNKLLTTLRLFKTGRVGASIVYRREPKWQPGHIVGGTGRDIYSVPVIGLAYKLKLQEAKDFLNFWKWLYHQPHGNNVEVAIRWFNHGYENWITEDRVISFVTALESLFLRKDERKRKNLVSRIPKLLNDTSSKIQSEKNVEDIWDLRSSVIHAGSYQMSDSPRLAEIAEHYLRESIKRYIELERQLTPHTHADIMKWLDKPDIDISKQAMFPHWKNIKLQSI